MPDKHPIRAELHYRDGRVVSTELHFSPPNSPSQLGSLPREIGNAPAFSVRTIRGDGVSVMHED
jgi:hypothetical protein